MEDYPHVALSIGQNALEFRAMHVGSLAHVDEVMPAVEAGAPASDNMNHELAGMNVKLCAADMNT